ncbi:TPA: hypothetical protein QC272_005779, partial [Bacillus cereus]|nr:hypothetical protein [Bacillus cereus]
MGWQDFRLSSLKKLVQFSAWRSASVSILDYLDTQGIHTFGELFSSKGMDILAKKLGFISSEELKNLVGIQIDEILEKDNSYSDDVIKEMAAHLFYLWELIFSERLYVLESESTLSNPTIWYMDPCHDEMGASLSGIPFVVNQEFILDFSDVEESSKIKDMRYSEFFKIELVYFELKGFIVPYLIELPK